MSVATSVAMSEASSHVSQSWKCHRCGYQNSSASQELCALCGIKETKHVEDYRQALQRKRAPGDVESYCWFDDNNNKKEEDDTEDQTETTSSPPVTVIMAKKKAPPPVNDNSHRVKPFQQPRIPSVLTTAPPKASFAERVQELNRVPTPKNSIYSSCSSSSKSVDDISTRALPPLLNRICQDNGTTPPPKPHRPPTSPKLNGSSYKSTLEKPLSVRPLAPRDDQWISFSEVSLGDVSGILDENCEGPSSTMAIMSGKGNTFFETASTTTTCEESVSKMSCSSRSTVKVSNITNPHKVFKMKINRETNSSQSKAATSTPMRFQSPEIDIGSSVAPSRAKGTPSTNDHGDVEQPSTTTLGRGRLFMPRNDKSAKSNMSSLARKFVPPVQLYHTIGDDSDSPVSRTPRVGELSLANAPHLPSVSSLASSTASSQFQPSLSASVQAANPLGSTGKGSTTDSASLSMIDTESQSIMMDERDEQDESEESRKPRRRMTRCKTIWLVLGVSMVGLAIALGVSLASSNSSSSTFQIFDDTEAPTSAPVTSPSSSNGGADPAFPIDLELDGGNISQYRIEQIASERDSAVEDLGVSVAVGSHRLAVMGNGFIRVQELVEVPSSSAILTWPRPTAETTHYSEKLLTVGDDINFTVTHESPQMSFSENGERLALLIDSGLFVYEYSNSDDAWKQIFTSRISDSRDPESYAYSSDKHTLPTSVSISEDGAFVAAGVIMPRTDDEGNTLVVNVWDMNADNETVLQFLEPLDKGEASAHDFLNIELSGDAGVLATCTRGGAFIGNLGGLQLEPLAPLGHTFDSCGLSGDGTVFTLSSRSVSTTIIYKSGDDEWDPLYVLPVTGTSVSLDFAGNLIAIGANHGLTLWVDDEDDDSFEQIISFPGQPEEGGLSAEVSVALSKASERDGEQFMVVGQNESVVIYRVVAPQ
ncbi:MAG: hypothetical protein SGILL_002565 [Bacillariaceae sp.]